MYFLSPYNGKEKEHIQFECNYNDFKHDEIKDLLIKFINNLQSKKINSNELKLWKRMNKVFDKIISQLP